MTRLTGTTDQPYLFVGQLGYYTHYQDQKLDPESQDVNKYVMLQLGVRYYSPEIGRFTQRDPFRDGLSHYIYVNSNPAISVDPDGRKPYDNVNPDERDADIREVGRCKAGCAAVTRRSAIRAVQAEYPGRNLFDDNLDNAVLHCTWTCMIAQNCGRNTAVVVTNNHEKYNWNPKTGPMDLANNGEGLDCFDSIGVPTLYKKSTSSCLDCCLKKRKDKKLHLPPKKPVSKYPGGNE